LTKRTPSDPSGEPEISLGVLMFIPYRHMQQRILDVVVDAGHPITLAQAWILQRVDHQGSRLTTLAESAQLTKQAAGFLVDQLERAGYVERGRIPWTAAPGSSGSLVVDMTSLPWPRPSR